MKRARASALLCGAIIFFAPPVMAQQITESSPPFSRIDGYLKMPNGRHMGSTSSVAGDSHGNIWVAERCGANDCANSPLDPILEFDSKGNFVKAFGAGQVLFPHFIFIDKADHIWIVDDHDNGKIGDDVIEYDENGRVLMTLGTPGVPGDDQTHFREPSSVLVAPNGDIFVGDGHTQGGAMPASSSSTATAGFWRNGAAMAALRARWIFRIAWRWTARAACLWATAATTGWIFSTRTAGSSPHGANSAVRAAASSTATTISMSPIPNPIPTIIPAGCAACASARSGTGVVTAFIPDDPGINPDNMGTSNGEGIWVDRNGTIYVAEVGQRAVVRYTPEARK